MVRRGARARAQEPDVPDDPEDPDVPPPLDHAATIAQLMQIVQDQSAQMQAGQQAMAQMQLEAATSRQHAAIEAAQKEAVIQARFANIAAVNLIGGIYGFKNGIMLGREERAFHVAVMGLSINRDTADELFRQGLSEMETLNRLTTEKLKNIIYNVSRNKSPLCPDKDTIFLGATFEDKMSVMITWLKFQHLIGAATTATAWNNDQQAMKTTTERIRHHQQVTESEGTRDIPLPDLLKDMQRFKDWDDHLNT